MRTENREMELNYFKDKLFDSLNESNKLGIADLDAEDGSIFEFVCREAIEKEDEWKNTN